MFDTGVPNGINQRVLRSFGLHHSPHRFLCSAGDGCLGLDSSSWKTCMIRSVDQEGFVMDADWKIVCDPSTFDKLKNTNEFGLILALARSVNAISYVHSTIPFTGEAEDRPSEVRSRINAFLFACAIVCEGFKVVIHMNTFFGSNPTFKNGLEALLADP